MVSIHTTQPYLAYKLTTIQLASRDTTLRAGITIRLIMERFMLIIIQDTCTKTHEQQVQLPAQLHLLHAILAAAYCSCWTLQCLSHSTRQLTASTTCYPLVGPQAISAAPYQLHKPEKRHTVNAIMCISIKSISMCSMCYLSCMLIIFKH